MDIEVAARQGAGDRSRTGVQHFSLRKQRLDPRSFSLKRHSDRTTERMGRLEVEVLATDLRTLSEVSSRAVQRAQADGAGVRLMKELTGARVRKCQPSDCTYADRVERAIRGFHLDAQGEWVAELACGHQQHVRHSPPFFLRPWVLEAEGRKQRLGTPLECRLCDQNAPAPARAPDAGGEAA